MREKPCPKIVVVGGGAGGLQLVSKLARSLGRSGKAQITLVDQALTHMWKPSLHEFAAGTKGSDSEISFLDHAHRVGYQFRLGRFAGVDFAQKHIKLDPVMDKNNEMVSPHRTLDFDYLVIAIGSRSNDFGCEGVLDNCWFLDTPDQAKKLQSELLNICLRFETGVLGEAKKDLHVCIVGGGATGVELAAELREATEQLGLHGIDKLKNIEAFHITLLEAAPRLLNGLPEIIGEKVAGHLKDLEIDVRLNARVDAVLPDKVVLSGGEELPAELTIWAAGIRAPTALAQLENVALGSLGRLPVRQTLQMKDYDNVFAMGDCAECDWRKKDIKLPPRAQVAAQQASFLHRQFKHLIDGRPLDEFDFVDRGSLVSIADSAAVGSFMGKSFGAFTIEGWLARRSYRFLHFSHEAVVQGFFRAFFKMLLSKAMKRLRPQLKLH